MLIGVSTHIHVYRPLDRELLGQIKAAGFEAAELYANPPHWPDYDKPASRRKLAETCLDLDLPIHSVHAPFYRNLEEARAGKWLSLTSRDPEVRKESVSRAAESLYLAEFAPFSCLVVHVGGADEVEDGGTFDRLFYSLEELGSLAEGLNVELALENITNSFSRGDRINSFIKESGLEGIGCCYDCAHAAIYGRMLEELAEMAEFLASTHLHDTTEGLDNHLMPFEGDIDWEKLTAAFAETDYDGALVIETKDDSNSPATLPAAKEAAESIRKRILRRRKD